MNLIKYALVASTSLLKLMGESGISYMTAPLPAFDSGDSPYTLTEIIFAKILSPLTN